SGNGCRLGCSTRRSVIRAIMKAVPSGSNGYRYFSMRISRANVSGCASKVAEEAGRRVPFRTSTNAVRTLESYGIPHRRQPKGAGGWAGHNGYREGVAG